MSDVLKAFECYKFEQEISLSTEHCLNYVRQQCSAGQKFSLTVCIPNEHLRVWYDLRENGKLSGFSYVEILNACIAEHGVKIQKDCTRIENLLYKSCYNVKNKSTKLVGRARGQYLSGQRKIAIRQDELGLVSVNIDHMEDEINRMRENEQKLLEENDQLQKRCEDLYKELQSARLAKDAIENNLEDMQNSYDEITSKNIELREYIKTIADSNDMKNNGKVVTDVGERQQRRKLRELKSHVERGLWFAETYGLTLDSASFTDQEGVNHTLSFTDQEKKKYQQLPEEEKEKIKQILFILDKFSVGEAAYHELTMTPVGTGLPRSYLVKQCKESFNKLCHIERTPGNADGAQFSFRDELCSIIKNDMRNSTISEDDQHPAYKVKLSGDGARMTRVTNFIVISFSILNDKDARMSSRGNHTVAIIKGSESYEILQTSCARIFKDVNKIVKDGAIEVDGKNVPVEMYLGGDYKFLLLVMGLKAATSDYACIWCTIHKAMRHDMTKPMNFYWENCRRTLADIKKCALKRTMSCEHLPLLNIPLENVVLDELHLMLRITDKLTKNLVKEAISRDQKENLNKAPCHRTTTHLDNLVNAISSCGVSFSVWQKKDADGKGSGLFDFTSLMGTDKVLLLKKLPDKLNGIITPATSNTVIQLWQDFNETYTLLKKEPTDEDIDLYFGKVTAWVTLFTSLGGKLEGYSKSDITPYIHSMVYHVPHFMQKHGSMKQFSGQGVEKLNDVCRRIHMQKSNKWDAEKDVLMVGKRIDLLSEVERTPRKYTKKAESYWIGGIIENRAKRPRLCHGNSNEENSTDVDEEENMTPAMIRSKLKELGINTRARNIKRLQEIYRVALQNVDTNELPE